MMYEEFKKANSTFQSRIEAFLSGILAPDLKGLTLQSMEPEVAYTKRELYERVCEFCEFQPRDFPVTSNTVWKYCYGHPHKRIKGSLHSIGTVVELKIKRKVTPYKEVYAVAYQKTDAGEDFGDPLVALGTYTVNRIRKEGAKYASLQRLLGSPTKSPNAPCRAGYTTFMIVRFLANNSDEEFRKEDILAELPELNRGTISSTLIRLGNAGIIKYTTPVREIEGKKPRGFVNYTLVKELDDKEKIISEVKKLKPSFEFSGTLSAIIDYINSHRDVVIEYRDISGKIKKNPKNVNHCLSLLDKLGYLSAEWRGGKNSERILSRVKANEITKILWEELFEPIERISYSLNPNVSGLRDKLDYYLDHKEEWKKQLKNQITIYEEERRYVGYKGGDEIKYLILKTLSNTGMKLSQISYEVNKICTREVGASAIKWHLKNLEREGKISKVKKGVYTKVV